MLYKLVVVAAFGAALLNPFFAFAKTSNDLIASAEQVKQAQLVIEKNMPQTIKTANLDLHSDAKTHVKETATKDNFNDLRQSGLSQASLAMFGLLCFVARAGRRRV